MTERHEEHVALSPEPARRAGARHTYASLGREPRCEAIRRRRS
jgi:hypothetical protein